ncbi:MAG: hypothetical protein BAJATHORv1_10423 [Candidatus Thorarchaeota archaeon]|nr:MAG: hypothetical protein BAJATHORv1_10423 [Candidatus Thorarchaeota archaeon]
MSNKRSIQGVWLIEKTTGRNLIARAYTEIEIDMDLIAPFLSATHTFIDKASNETLKTIDTETSRYVWSANEHLLFVMVVSKRARLPHMRFILDFAMNEFMRKVVPKTETVETMLNHWPGVSTTFNDFAEFVDELVSQYEETDECLVAGKSMDCLEVYSHLIRALLRIDVDKGTRKKIMSKVQNRLEPILESYQFLQTVPIDNTGIEILSVDVYNVSYRHLRNGLEDLLKVLADVIRSNVDKTTYREMLFEYAMPYVKRDIDRLQTYAILDDVVRYLF